MIRYRVENWKNHYPSNLLEYLHSPTSLGVRITNFLFQKILRINGKVKYMVHYTSCAMGKLEVDRSSAVSIASSPGCYWQGINGIVIGKNTIIAPNVSIISANHSVLDHKEHIDAKPVIIGNGCWLGAGCVILPEVSLGDNVVVGAGAIVTKSFPANCIIVGNPAKIIRTTN